MDESQANQAALAQGRNFVWHELNTTSQQDSIAFYTEALDFGTLSMDMGEMGPYNMLTRNGVPVCGVTSQGQVPNGNVPSHWSTYLAVDDVDARIEKCTSLGATVVVPAMDVPTVGRMAMIKDPQGAHIWLFKPDMG